MNSKQFDVEPLVRFAGANAAIRRPKEFAYFSYDDEHHFRLDDSSLRYYYPPVLPVSLSQGFESFQQLDDTGDDHLDSLLQTIASHEKEKGSSVAADFITWRGMMTKIMATPFDRFSSFEMNATVYQGTIFIEENHEYKLASKDAQRTQQTRPGAASQDLMSYWGYKFETLSLIPEPWDPTSREYIESRTTQVVNNYAQYCSVVRTGIGSTKMIIGGEVDAVWDCKPENPNEPINWVELKTSAEIYNDRDMIKFERKLLKFWIQSFLLGVPKIVVGFRDSEGMLRRLEELATQEIPGKVQTSGKRTWDGNICINFTANFLEWLKHAITGEGVWRIRKREKIPMIEVFRLEDTGYGNILSKPFVDWRESRSNETSH